MIFLYCFGLGGASVVHTEAEEGQTPRPAGLSRPFTATVEVRVDENWQERWVLSVHSHSDQVIREQTQVAATIIGPNRRRVVRPLRLTDLDYWRASLSFDLLGHHEITVHVTGRDKNNELFRYRVTPVDLGYRANTRAAPLAHSPKPTPSEPTGELAAGAAVEGASRRLRYAVFVLTNFLLFASGYIGYRKFTAHNNPVRNGSDSNDSATADLKTQQSWEEEPSDSMADPDHEPPMEDLDLADFDDLKGRPPGLGDAALLNQSGDIHADRDPGVN